MTKSSFFKKIDTFINYKNIKKKLAMLWFSQKKYKMLQKLFGVIIIENISGNLRRVVWSAAAHEFTYSLSYKLTTPISTPIGQHLIFCSLTSLVCCNSPRKCTPDKYKATQKAGFPIVTSLNTVCNMALHYFRLGCPGHFANQCNWRKELLGYQGERLAWRTVWQIRLDEVVWKL